MTSGKITAYLMGIVIAFSFTSAVGQGDKTDLSTNDQRSTAEAAKREALSAASREKLAKAALLEKAADTIVVRRFVFSGPLITLFHSHDPLPAFNPFSISNSGAALDHVRLDPYLRPPRGFTLFRLEF
jgi:hypothetical protein